MRIWNRFGGPRLGTKLALLGLLLLVVPWFSYRQLVAMEDLLIQGQSNTQLLMAEGISTLFNGRDQLFSDLPISTADYEALYAYPVDTDARLDGLLEDWGEGFDDRLLRFGAARDGGATDGTMDVVIGEKDEYLWGFVRVFDETPVFRDTNTLSLDRADHLRLSFIRADGEDGRITLTLPGPGVQSAFRVDENWRRATTGRPEAQIRGFSRVTNDGYELEFRLPLEMLGSKRYFAMIWADVDDPAERAIERMTQTLPTAGKESFELVVFRSQELLDIIEGLGYAGARVIVIDSEERVRAETGSVQGTVNSEPEGSFGLAFRQFFSRIRPTLHRLVTGQEWPIAEPTRRIDDVIASALRGEPNWLQRTVEEQQEVIIAAHPIVSRDRILGAVMVEQNTAQILSFQRTALEELILLSVLSLLIVFVALIAFAGRLAWRIRSLRQEASAAIDQHGRLKTSGLKSEMTAGDEIGDLARSVSNMLSKLHSHNRFLENMPRTLRHEINNPLNTLSTSLQNLAEEIPGIQTSKYLDSAKRGVLRIGQIVQNLADAANLEEALEAEELETLDIQELLENYVANCSLNHKTTSFVYRGVDRPAYARVADYRIEQLLDKIVDNAVDFHRSNSPIKVQLDVTRDALRISVANRGPLLPADAQTTLFDSMVSHRDSHSQLHFGLGLYVVRLIAEYHGGSAQASNLADGSGVVFVVQLPLAAPPARRASGSDDYAQVAAG
ncbi:MAG: ATP-binding protein [Pseudomonadota bacterium]